MRPVIQHETTGCGIACAATLAGISYAQAKKIAAEMGISTANPKLWSNTKPMRTLLTQLKVKIARREKPFTGWEKLPDCALLAIKWHLQKNIPFWHWTVFVREGEKSCVLDPKKVLRNNKRTDFGRIKPKWFIEVKL